MDWKSRKVRAILERALIEDKAAQDITTALTIDRKLRATGTIVARQPCVLAGLGCIPAIMDLFSELAAAKENAPVARFSVISHPEIFDGVKVKKGQPIAVIRSNATALFSTERVMLNLLQRMCGIATLTDEFVRAVAGTKAKILDTRKTVPGLRVLDRYAVCCGGGLNHRHDLEDGIAIKANHIAVGGGLAKTLDNALKFRNKGQQVQVEVRSQAELDEAIAGGPESILLNYMTPAAVKKSVKQIRAQAPGVTIEAAGSITLANVKKYAAAGVDFVAVGALTTAPALVDLSLKITVHAS
jgi:nicotinate-nucleotide pyrophosphorylase (carboxylating)